MAGSESDYGDQYGLPHENRAQWGAIAEQQRQAAALRGMNPAASQFINNSASTAPTQKSVAQRGAQLQRGVSTAKSVAPQQPTPAAQPIPREYGQPRRGAGAPPGAPLQGMGQTPQAPLGGGIHRGYGASSGLLPEDNPSQRNYFNGGPAHYFRQLAALPNASPQIQFFARKYLSEEGSD